MGPFERLQRLIERIEKLPDSEDLEHLREQLRAVIVERYGKYPNEMTPEERSRAMFLDCEEIFVHFCPDKLGHDILQVLLFSGMMLMRMSGELTPDDWDVLRKIRDAGGSFEMVKTLKTMLAMKCPSRMN